LFGSIHLPHPALLLNYWLITVNRQRWWTLATISFHFFSHACQQTDACPDANAEILSSQLAPVTRSSMIFSL
jgi:hypothetical protein